MPRCFCFQSILCFLFVCLMCFWIFYHGKSPLKHHLKGVFGERVYFQPPNLRKSNEFVTPSHLRKASNEWERCKRVNRGVLSFENRGVFTRREIYSERLGCFHWFLPVAFGFSQPKNKNRFKRVTTSGGNPHVYMGPHNSIYNCLVRCLVMSK